MSYFIIYRKKLLVKPSTSCSHCQIFVPDQQYQNSSCPTDLWPPNSPDLNPVNYNVWGHLWCVEAASR